MLLPPEPLIHSYSDRLHEPRQSCLNPAVIKIAAAVEDHTVDSFFDRTFCNRLTDPLGSIEIAPVEPRKSFSVLDADTIVLPS